MPFSSLMMFEALLIPRRSAHEKRAQENQSATLMIKGNPIPASSNECATRASNAVRPPASRPTFASDCAQSSLSPAQVADKPQGPQSWKAGVRRLASRQS